MMFRTDDVPMETVYDSDEYVYSIQRKQRNNQRVRVLLTILVGLLSIVSVSLMTALMSINCDLPIPNIDNPVYDVDDEYQLDNNISFLQYDSIDPSDYFESNATYDEQQTTNETNWRRNNQDKIETLIRTLSRVPKFRSFYNVSRMLTLLTFLKSLRNFIAIDWKNDLRLLVINPLRRKREFDNVLKTEYDYPTIEYISPREVSQTVRTRSVDAWLRFNGVVINKQHKLCKDVLTQYGTFVLPRPVISFHRVIPNKQFTSSLEAAQLSANEQLLLLVIFLSFKQTTTSTSPNDGFRTDCVKTSPNVEGKIVPIYFKQKPTHVCAKVFSGWISDLQDGIFFTVPNRMIIDLKLLTWFLNDIYIRSQRYRFLLTDDKAVSQDLKLIRDVFLYIVDDFCNTMLIDKVNERYRATYNTVKKLVKNIYNEGGDDYKSYLINGTTPRNIRWNLFSMEWYRQNVIEIRHLSSYITACNKFGIVSSKITKAHKTQFI